MKNYYMTVGIDAKPFVETLLNLFENNMLSNFDFNFLGTWLGKRIRVDFIKLMNRLKD